MPDPWVWEQWMLDALIEGGCDLDLGTPADAPDAAALSPAEMAARLANADGVIIHSRESITAASLVGPRRLRVIAKMGIGVERIDVAAATAAGVLVTNTPVEENYQGLAEGTVALLLSLLKRLPAKERQLRAGRWRDRHTAGDLLADHTLGIIGLGRVGSRVAELLRDWPIQVLAVDPYVAPEVAAAHGARLVTLSDLLREASVISVHIAPRAGDLPIIGEAELLAMRRGSYLINTSRGSVLDETALVAALRRGHLAGAALDVFDHEPLAADHPMRDLDNVILTPHAVGTSRASQRAICLAAVECCLAGLRGVVPRHVVNSEVIPTWQRRLATMAATQ
jgi:D-3-phosphoglycerate dehydrogenase